MGHTLRTDRHRFTLYSDKAGKVTGRMLYDHRDDPDEHLNLAELPENSALVAELTRRLRAEMGRPFNK